MIQMFAYIFFLQRINEIDKAHETVTPLDRSRRTSEMGWDLNEGQKKRE